MKKLLLFLAAVMMLAALTGCPQNTSEASGQDAADAVSQPAEENTAQPSSNAAQPSSDAAQPQTEQLFDALELNIARGTMYIRTGDSFSYTGHDGSAGDYEITGKTLCISQNLEGETVLTVPEDLTYISFRLTVGEGHVYAESAFVAQTLELNVTRGEVTISAATVTDSSTIEVRQGSAFLSGDLGNSVAASSTEGNLSMEVPAAQNDYNFAIDLSTGNIHLGTQDYHGLSFSQSIDNGAARSMTLNCARGNLSVEFDVRH